MSLAALLRRQGDSRLFDEALGEGVTLRGIYDYVTGGAGTFDRYHVLQEFSSMVYVLGRYYSDVSAMRNARLESGTRTRGGRDYAYASITHPLGF